MSKFQSIQNKLREINPTLFQELCDKFLALQNRNYIAFSRSGSQVGKQKTTRGTPDSFFLLPSGKFVFVETTTNVTDKDKLKKDIQSCFDFKKSKIESEKIDEIILCYNFNIDQTELSDLLKLARSFKRGINIEFWSLDRLSMDLQFNHRDLLAQYLDLPYDTGQIVSVDTFIEEYNKKANGVATSLDSGFLHRADETDDLKTAINNHNFTLVTGGSGVGKTKLVVETLKDYVKENPDFSAYCISYKSGELLGDLYQCFDKEKNYLLFVDDANRMDGLNEVLGFYNAKRSGELKIILTARSYAIQQLSAIYLNYSPVEIRLGKLTNDQILDIVKSRPFEITNSDYHPSIARISNGNPRIAIMAARLAKRKQKISALEDVGALFELYFSNYIEENAVLFDKVTHKTLGLISFFFTLHLKREVLSPILKDFDIEYPDFIDAVEKLERHELVETKYEYVKIPEQNLSTYFFFKAFIKDKILSFDSLLKNYYTKHKARFRDTIIPTNNNFGGKKVMDEVRPYLQNYWQSIKEDQEKAIEFAMDFWFYLIPEVTLFLFYEINSMEKLADRRVITSYETNQFVYNRDGIVELIGEFLRKQTGVAEYLELMFEYAIKKTSVLPEVIYEIRSKTGISREDEKFGFGRQKALVELFQNKLSSENREVVYVHSFWELSKTLLQFQFEHFGGGINRNSFTIGYYSIGNSFEIKGLRESIWNLALKNYHKDPDLGIDFLFEYGQGISDINSDILLFDVNYLFKMVDQELSPGSFKDCKVIHRLVLWLRRRGINKEEYADYLVQYSNPMYEMYLKLDWNRFRDKECMDFDNYDEYVKLKENEMRTSFGFKSIHEFKDFYKSYLTILSEFDKDLAYDHKSLNFVLDENFKSNFELGLEFLNYIIQKRNQLKFQPYLLFGNHLKTIGSCDKIWNEIKDVDFEEGLDWKLSFFYNLNKTIISQKHIDLLIESVTQLNSKTTIWFRDFEKYLQVDKTVIEKIVRIIYSKNEDNDLRISVGIDFFGSYFDHLGSDFKFIQSFYLQQQFDEHVDYKRTGLKKILDNNPEFLMDFILNMNNLKNVNLYRESSDLSFIWEIANIESQVKKVFDHAAENIHYMGISKHFCNSFFSNKNKDYSERENEFLMDYLSLNYQSRKKVNIVVDVVRHSKKELFNSVLLKYIDLNQDPEDFSRIYWRGNGGTVHGGDTIISEIEAAEWRDIQETVNKSDLGMKIIPIKVHIQKEIDWCMKSAKMERERKFLEID